MVGFSPRGTIGCRTSTNFDGFSPRLGKEEGVRYQRKVGQRRPRWGSLARK
jgi:hypothetical protein